MTRRRRAAAIAALVLTSMGSAAAAQADWGGVPVPPTGGDPNGDWVCVYVDAAQFGYCQSDPLPDRLPLPRPE